MALVFRFGRIGISPPIFAQNVRCASYWNKDWKPAQYPKTQAERDAAAKKYGLRIEDYDVYPDDGTGYGDYPKLPLISEEHRDQYEDYDMMVYKRNYGEPLNVNYDMLGEERLNINYKPYPSYPIQACVTGTILGCIIMAHYLYRNSPFFLPVMPKQYPYNELWEEKGGDSNNMPKVTHYNYDPVD